MALVYTYENMNIISAHCCRNMITVNYLFSSPGGLLVSCTIEGGLLERGAYWRGGLYEGEINFLKCFNGKLNICCLKIENNIQSV